MSNRWFATAFALIVSACLASPVEAADRLRFAILKTGTVGWEIELIKARGLDKAADLEIETTELASTEAGKIALEGGSADIVVSDWLWVARERGLGDKLLFAPYSSALGAVMTPKESPIQTIADLEGRSIGVAGGPIDKSWLLLRAAAARAGLDLAKSARPSYGAPPLVAEKLAQGETEAALEFWNFAADLETRGFSPANKDALRRYFAAVAEAREILANDPGAWEPIKARLKLKDDEALETYRKRYLDGIPKRPIAEEAADARILYRALADIGGKGIAGDARELDAGLFYDPKKGE